MGGLLWLAIWDWPLTLVADTALLPLATALQCAAEASDRTGGVFRLQATTHWIAPDPVTTSAFSRDGCWAVTGTDSGTVKVWRLNDGDLPQEFGRARGHFPALSPDGRFLLTSRKNEVEVYRLSSHGLESHAVIRAAGGASQGPRHGLLSGALSNDLLATGGDERLTLWRLTPAGVEALESIDAHGISKVALSPQGCWLAGVVGPHLKLWAVSQRGDELVLLPHNLGLPSAHARDSAERFGFSANGRWFHASGGKADAMLYGPLGDSPGAVGLPRRPLAALDAGGRRVLTGGLFHEVARLWDVGLIRAEASDPLPPGPGDSSGAQRGGVSALALSDDGRRALVGRSHGWAEAWSLGASPTRIADLRSTPYYSVESAALSPDGRWALVGWANGLAKLWRLPSLDR